MYYNQLLAIIQKNFLKKHWYCDLLTKKTFFLSKILIVSSVVVYPNQVFLILSHSVNITYAQSLKFKLL